MTRRRDEDVVGRNGSPGRASRSSAGRGVAGRCLAGWGVAGALALWTTALAGTVPAAETEEDVTSATDEIDEVPTEADSDYGTDDEAAAASSSPGDASTEEAPGPHRATDPIFPSQRARHEALAAAALHRETDPENHFGLAIAVAERTADLPWVLTIENQGAHPVRLAALPSLLTLQIEPPDEGEDDGKGQDAANTSREATPKTVECGEKPPRSVALSETVLLPPQARLVYSFDPRELCEDSSVLREGSKVVLRYGFPTDTKRLWKGGRLVEVETEQRAPFLAVDVRADQKETSEEALTSLKHLTARPLHLGRTYPLDQFTADTLAEAKAADEERASDASVGAPGVIVPPPPFELTLSPLGKTSAPEDGTIRVRVRNVSTESQHVYLRREHLSYQVSGPSGSMTCRMYPAHLSASSVSFSKLSPGESRTLTTRLAEACPPETWGTPGEYVVAALFSPNEDGARFGLQAFVGEVQSSNLARLTLVGPSSARRAPMRVILAE